MFFALMATSFGRHDHDQANAIKNLKKDSLHVVHKMSSCVGPHLYYRQYEVNSLK